MPDGLRKRQLITSFVNHFIENRENTICIGFQFHNPKLSQEGCLKTYIFYKRLFTGCSTIEPVDSFFRKALSKKS